MADGTPAAIKASIGMKVIRCTVPGASPSLLAGLPGAASVEMHGGGPRYVRSRRTRPLRALLAAHGDASNFEVSGIALENAFLALTDERETQ